MDDDQRPVIVGFDGSDHGRGAVVWAAYEAARMRRRLVVLTVGDDTGVGLRGPVSMSHLVLRAAREDAQRIADAGAGLARDSSPGVTAEALVVLGHPPRVLPCSSRDAALLVVGTRARGPIAEMALGSVAGSVAGRCSCPVALVRAGVDAHPDAAHPVVVGVDGSRAGLRAAVVAAAMAAGAGAPLTAVAAWSARVPSSREVAEQAVDEAVEQARAACPSLQVDGVELEGRAAEVLTRRACSAGLLVVGSQGHGTVRNALLGSVGFAVAHLAPCPVAVVGPSCAVPPVIAAPGVVAR